MMQANFNFVYRSTADIIYIKYFLNLHLLAIDYHFYQRDAMLARVIAIATCPSVRPSVCHAPVLCQNEES